MKIIVESTDDLPRHSLSRADVKSLLRALPVELTQSIDEVHLHDGLASRWKAVFSRSEHRLVIASRGEELNAIVRAVIRELLAAAGHEKGGYSREARKLPRSVVERRTDELSALALVQIEEDREMQKMKKQKPNQALQATPMTRSVYERTIEFGHPQRGV